MTLREGPKKQQSGGNKLNPTYASSKRHYRKVGATSGLDRFAIREKLQGEKFLLKWPPSRLLLLFAQKQLRKEPAELDLDDLNASFINAFLDHLSASRDNGARSRKLRLTAVRSFFRYAALEAPAHAATIRRVQAIPNQRQPRALVDFLTRPEICALLAAPNQATWLGRRDYAFLLTACFARHRRACSLAREGAQGTLSAFDQAHRIGTQGLDAGARERRFQELGR